MRNKVLKIIIIFIVFLIILGSSRGFLKHKKDCDKFVASTCLEKVKYLSDYEPSLKNTNMDSPVYFFDSQVEGGTVFIMSGAHPNECGSILATYILMENLNIEKGKIIVLPVGNLSAQTSSCIGNAYPISYSVKTSWGEKEFKIGDRSTNFLDQWPDPPIFIQYPSFQSLSFQEARNINRTYPGRGSGSLTERTSFAISKLLEKESVDLAFDCHEASLTYPVNQTIVSSEIGEDIAFISSFLLQEKGINMKVEVSQDSLYGYSHSEWPSKGAISFLLEVPNPFQDRITGPMTENLMKTGKDDFLLKLHKKGFINIDYDENGSSLEKRAGMTLETISQIIFCYNQMNTKSEIVASWPTFEDLITKNVGFFFHNPNSKENIARVCYVQPKKY